MSAPWSRGLSECSRVTPLTLCPGYSLDWSPHSPWSGRTLGKMHSARIYAYMVSKYLIVIVLTLQHSKHHVLFRCLKTMCFTTYCRFYSMAPHFHRLLWLVVNQVAEKACCVVGKEPLTHPYIALTNIRQALRLCAAFRYSTSLCRRICAKSNITPLHPDSFNK